MADIIIPAGKTVMSTEQLTVDGTSGGVQFTSSKIFPTSGAPATYCVLKCVAQSVRVTFDGTAPVAATTGVLLAAGDTLTLGDAGSMKALKAIRETGSSGELHAIFCR